MVPRIQSFELQANRTIKVRLNNGRSGTVDLAPLLAIGGIYESLNNEDTYRAAQIVDGGLALSWPGGVIELSAAGLNDDLENSASTRPTKRPA